MFSGMYDMPTISDGVVERVDDDLLLDILPTDTDLYVGESKVAQEPAARVINLEDDADWLQDPASLMIVSKDAPEAENVVQYTDDEESCHRAEIAQRTDMFRHLMLTKCGLTAIASDRACAEVEAILRDVYNLNVNVVNCVPEFASLVMDIDILSKLLAEAPNVSAEVRDAMIKRVADTSIDDMFAARKAAARVKSMKQLIQKNSGLVGGHVGSAVMATLSDRSINGKKT